MTTPRQLRQKVLFLGHLPPPVHGASVMSEVARDALASRYELEAIRISTSLGLARLGSASWRKVFLFLGLAWRVLVASARIRPDLVYVTLSPTTSAFVKDSVLLAIARIFTRRAVIHLHGKGVRLAANRSAVARFAYRRVLRLGLVVHLSEGLVADVAWAGCRVAVLNNGLDVPVPTDRVRDVDVLFLSNLLEAKGVLVLAEALRVLGERGRRASVVLCGRYFSEDERRALEGALARIPAGIAVTLREGAYGAEKLELLARARVFVLPTFYPNECFPLSILEAMAAGAAIVSTPEGAIPDIVERNGAGVLVPQRDALALANALEGLLLEPDRVEKYGAAARSAYLRRYTELEFRGGLLDLVAGELARPLTAENR